LNQTRTLTNYDGQAAQYDQYRRPSPILLGNLVESFQGAKKPILSFGCGTCRLECELSKHYQVIGMDLSAGMLTQACERLDNLVLGDMTRMPYKDGCASGVYFMQSLHHIGANRNIHDDDRKKARKEALKEAIRVLDRGPIIIVQRDPTQNQAVWFWKYFPKALETKLMIQPKVSEIVSWLNTMSLSNVEAIPIDDPMAKGFYNPETPLDPRFRSSFSEFSYLSEEDIREGVENLSKAIQDGSALEDIKQCRNRFKEIGGTVHFIKGEKL